MRLDDIQESSNVEDDRGGGGGGFSLPGGIGVGGGGFGLVIGIVVLLLTHNPQAAVSAGMAGSQIHRGGGMATSRPGPGINDDNKVFISKILKETEVVWTDYFAQRGQRYEQPKLRIFSDQVNTGCGPAQSAMGPFYCPADRIVYIDPSFYDIMRDRLKAGGEFAKAYVIAHEVGHHVQNLLGTSDKVDQARRRTDEVHSNQLSVRMELQADFYAGVWANHAKDLQLTQSDVQEAVNAANQIGDDTLQRNFGNGRINPSAFTHGTSEQRMRWFTKGYQTGDIEQGDTFNANPL